MGNAAHPLPWQTLSHSCPYPSSMVLSSATQELSSSLSIQPSWPMEQNLDPVPQWTPAPDKVYQGLKVIPLTFLTSKLKNSRSKDNKATHTKHSKEIFLLVFTLFLFSLCLIVSKRLRVLQLGRWFITLVFVISEFSFTVTLISIDHSETTVKIDTRSHIWISCYILF